MNPNRDTAVRGLDYLLAAQYANGGWPQIFPLREDYARHMTFNDNAMVNVLVLLDEVGSGRVPFEFVDDARRRRARAVRGVAAILKAQVVVHAELTAWCAQHDEVTLQPRPARTYEHVSLSGMETVGIVRFLMTQPPTPDVVRAIDAAVAWLRRVRLSDSRWARFYELGTNRPIFSGRDGVIKYRLEEIEQERRDGYAWLGTWPRALVDEEYGAWKKHRRSRDSGAFGYCEADQISPDLVISCVIGTRPGSPIIRTRSSHQPPARAAAASR